MTKKKRSHVRYLRCTRECIYDNLRINSQDVLKEQVLCPNCLDPLSCESRKDKTHYYLLVIWGDVEPEIHGPFETTKERDKKAREIRSGGDESGIFPLDITSEKVPEEIETWAYSNMFFEENCKEED